MENRASNRKKQTMELDEAVKKTLEKVKHKILVLSGKGGVGKSTVAANLAAALAAAGRNVGLMDVDLHGPSIPMLLGLTGRRAEFTKDRIIPVQYAENLKVVSIGNLMQGRDQAVIWRGPLKNKAITQFIGNVEWGSLDYLVVDSPPGTGDEPLSVAQLIPGAHAIVVTTPQEISLADVRKSVSFCREVGMPLIGMIENMSGYVCPNCGHHDDIFGAGGGERTAKQMGLKLLGEVPIDSSVVRAGDQGLPSLSQQGESPAAEAFKKVVDAVLLSLGDNV
jgi:ATP-binding protein involved in chromosome partitioning